MFTRASLGRELSKIVRLDETIFACLTNDCMINLASWKYTQTYS
jgi:hypothetical protein